MRWEDGLLKQLDIYSKLGGNCRIRAFEDLAIPGAIRVNSNAVQPNPFYVVDTVKDPLFSKGLSAGMPSLRNIFEYDITTVAGKRYSFKF